MANLNVINWAQIARENYHYAWSIVAIGTFMRVISNFVSQAFGLVLIYLILEFPGESLTSLVLIQVFRSLVSAALSPTAGWIGDKYGAKRSLFLASAMFVIGMLLMSQASHVWQLYLYYSFLLGVAQAIFSVNIPTTVAAWFKTRLGIAVGVQQSLGGMGGAIAAPALALIFTKLEWEGGFLLVGLVGGALIFALLPFFHGDPTNRGMKPFGATGDDLTPTSNNQFTKIRTQVFLQAVRRTPSFWNLIGIHHLGCLGHSIVMWHIVYFATDTHEISPAAGSWIIFCYVTTSMFSRFATPILAEKFGSKGVMAVFYTIQGLTVLLLFWAQEPWQFYLFATLFGVGFGGEMSAFLVINRQYYGMGPVRSVFGFQHLGSGTGMALGGLIGGALYDVFGTYDISWIVSIGASLTGTICILFLQSTAQVLIPDWEESLPAEARTAPVT